MPTTFNDLNDAELGRLLRSRYDRLCAAHDMGLSDEHPSESWARDTETLKAYRATGDRAKDEGGLGPVEIERGSDSEAEEMPDNPNFTGDDPPEFPGKPANPQRGKPAEDAALAEHQILLSGHHDVAGQVAAHRARQANPRTVRSVALAIKGYDRIR